jgi:hypothetical protein
MRALAGTMARKLGGRSWIVAALLMLRMTAKLAQRYIYLTHAAIVTNQIFFRSLLLIVP